MRCKHGDLAVIVNDFEGCEGNLGVIVEVIGPPEHHPNTPLICWQVVPVRRRKLWLADDEPIKEFVSKLNPAMHPDAWLLPINGRTLPCGRLEPVTNGHTTYTATNQLPLEPLRTDSLETR
jgi:hypothetical protein